MRVIFGNIYIKYGNKILLMNLISFRREFLTQEEFDMLKLIELKSKQSKELNYEESILYNKLLKCKQILLPEVVTQADELIKNDVNKIYPYIRAATINLTYNCNFKCNYCYQRHFENKNLAMSIDDIEKIYVFLKNCQIRSGQEKIVEQLCISGGESLLPQNIDIINRILELFKDVKTKLFTNGVNIKKCLNKIDFRKFDELQISLDGDDYVILNVNNYRGPETLRTILDSIKKILDMNIKVSLIVMVTKETVEHHQPFMKTLKEYGFDKYYNLNIRFAPIVNNAVDKPVDEDFYDTEQYSKLIREIKNKHMLFKNCFIDPIYGVFNLQEILFI